MTDGTWQAFSPLLAASAQPRPLFGGPAEGPCTCSQAWPRPPTNGAPLSAPGAAAKDGPGLVASRPSLPSPALRADSDERPSTALVINPASDGPWPLQTQGYRLVVGSVSDAVPPSASAVCRRPPAVRTAATALPALCLTSREEGELITLGRRGALIIAVQPRPLSSSIHSFLPPFHVRPFPPPGVAAVLLCSSRALSPACIVICVPPLPPHSQGLLPGRAFHGERPSAKGGHTHTGTRDPCGPHSQWLASRQDVSGEFTLPGPVGQAGTAPPGAPTLLRPLTSFP